MTVKDYEDRYDVAQGAWRLYPNERTAQALDRARAALWRVRGGRHMGCPHDWANP